MSEVDGPIRVGVIGALGRMGLVVCEAVRGAEDMDLVWSVDQYAGPDFRSALSSGEAQVMVDFTHPDVAASHAFDAIRAGVSPIVGTSGLSTGDLQQLATLSEEAGVPAMFVPNFAIGAVLMMRFAEQAARWMPQAEIIEMHHDCKVDAPSGTSQRTAEMIADARAGHNAAPQESLVRVEGVRGGEVEGVRIHSVRLPGKLAHQMVIFGSQGECLTLQHDSNDRSSFMPGVLLAIREVRKLRGLTVGLESLLV